MTVKLLVGALLIAAGALRLCRMATRDDRPVGPGQALLDFTTGAPLESVLAVGAIVFGLIVAVAALL